MKRKKSSDEKVSFHFFVPMRPGPCPAFQSQILFFTEVVDCSNRSKEPLQQQTSFQYVKYSRLPFLKKVEKGY